MTVLLAVFKTATVSVLGLLAFGEWLVAAEQAPYVNVVLNLASLVVLVVGLALAPRAFKAKAMEAELKEKDRIIATRGQSIEAVEEKCEHLSEKAAELGAMLDEARAAAATWEARYVEQEKYTAGPALEAITQLLANANAEAAQRHKEMLLVLRSLRALAPGAPPFDDEGGGLG